MCVQPDASFLLLISLLFCTRRRFQWAVLRLENEHLNNVGKFRAVKFVPIPFDDDRAPVFHQSKSEAALARPETPAGLLRSDTPGIADAVSTESL